MKVLNLKNKNCCFQVLDIFEIPVISYSATSYELNDKTQYEYFSRTIPSDLSQVQAIVEFLQYFNWTYVSAVYTDDPYGTYGMKLLKEEAKKRGEFKFIDCSPACS